MVIQTMVVAQETDRIKHQLYRRRKSQNKKWKKAKIRRNLRRRPELVVSSIERLCSMSSRINCCRMASVRLVFCGQYVKWLRSNTVTIMACLVTFFTFYSRKLCYVQTWGLFKYSIWEKILCTIGSFRMTKLGWWMWIIFPRRISLITVWAKMHRLLAFFQVNKEFQKKNRLLTHNIFH